MQTFEDNRRDRWTRDPRVLLRLPTLQARDLAVLRLLNRYPVLRSTWLYALTGGAGDETWFKKRLGLLFHGATANGETFGPFLDRPVQQKDAHNARYQPSFYCLAVPGERHLMSLGDTVHQAREFIRNGRVGKIRQFAHTVATCDVLADIEHGVSKWPSLRFINSDEILAAAPRATREAKNPFAIPVTISHDFGKREALLDTHYVADGWFGIEHTFPNGSVQRSYFALEINHGDNVRANNLKDATHLRKMLSLRAIRRKQLSVSHFGIKTPITALFVQSDKSVTENSMGLLRELSEGQGSAFFAFKTISHFKNQERAPLPNGTTLTEPWQRVGFEPLHLDKPEGR